MSVVVVIPHEEVWKVSGAAFRMLAKEAAGTLVRDGDREVLTRSEAVNCLFFEDLDAGQAHRLALAMQRASDPSRI